MQVRVKLFELKEKRQSEEKNNLNSSVYSISIIFKLDHWKTKIKGT